MKQPFQIFAVLSALSTGATIQAQSSEPGLTAREMFLAARDNKAANVTPRPKRKTPAPETKPEAGEVAATGTPSTRVPRVQTNPDLIPAGYSSTPLGMRYTIVKREGSQSVDVPTDTVFHNGDKIHLAVEVTEPGFLYIVSRGSSGTWEVLFPSAKIENGDNHVTPRGRYVVPQGYVFAFSGKPGNEKLFVVFSRRPEPEIDSLIYSLQNNRPKPVSEPADAKPTREPMILASAKPINDSVIDLLRTTYSRDLIIEPVNENAGPKQEHSVYVVNPKGTADSRVVADISLDHQ